MTIRMVVMLMFARGGIAHVVDVNGTFVYGEFNNGKKVYIKIPIGFEKVYDEETVLL
jgi:hypothetical protein